jgi:hypothetical protein
VFAVAEARESIAPPPLDPHGEWFERAEAFLAACVDPHAAFDIIPPALESLAVLHDPAARDRDDAQLAHDEALRAEVARLVAERTAKGLASRGFWWTSETDRPEPLVMIEAEMPDPIAFTHMLTVRHARCAQLSAQLSAQVTS